VTSFRASRLVLLPALLIAAAILPARAQAAAAEPPADLSKLVSAVERLVQVLEQDVKDRAEGRETERLQVLVAVLNIRYRKTETLESEIHDIDTQEESVRSSLLQLKTQLETIDEPEETAGESNAPQSRAMRKLFQSQVKDLEEQLVRLEDRKVQTQNDLAAARKRLAQLESSLEDWIEKQTSRKP